VPSDEHDGATDEIVGCTGVVNITALLKLADAAESQLPLFEITV
jgi:hypothetical protein